MHVLVYALAQLRVLRSKAGSVQLMGETSSKQGHIHEHRTGFESKQVQNYESNECVWFE